MIEFYLKIKRYIYFTLNDQTQAINFVLISQEKKLFINILINKNNQFQKAKKKKDFRKEHLNQIIKQKCKNQIISKYQISDVKLIKEQEYHLQVYYRTTQTLSYAINVCCLTLISVEEVLSVEQTEPIENWPLGIDGASYEFLKNKKADNLKQLMRQGINQFYKQLKTSINKMLNDSEKKQIIELEKINIGSDSVIDLYNNLFKKQELKDIFLSKQQFNQDQFQNLINSLSGSSQKDLKEFSKQMEERKQNERQYRLFQQVEISNLLNGIISKVNDSITSLIFPEEQENELFENKPFLLISGYERKEDELRTKLKKLIDQMNSFIKDEGEELLLKRFMTIIYPYENKSMLQFENQDFFEIDYEENGVIRVSNPKQNANVLVPYFFNLVGEKISFKLKFNEKKSLLNFSFAIFLDKKDSIEYDFTLTFKKICKYLEQTKQTLELQIEIDSKKNLFLLSAVDGFNLQQDINFKKAEDNQYNFQFTLKKDCAGFELSDYEETIIEDSEQKQIK